MLLNKFFRTVLLLSLIFIRLDVTRAQEITYAERLQKDAPEGTPIEDIDASTGTYEWEIKQE